MRVWGDLRYNLIIKISFQNLINYLPIRYKTFYAGVLNPKVCLVGETIISFIRFKESTCCRNIDKIIKSTKLECLEALFMSILNYMTSQFLR